MTSPEPIHVNFGKPMPVFPLHTVAALPQQVIPLHIFEDRYRQMIAEALDGSGQFAIAVFEGDRWKKEYHANPPIKPAVCIAQIVRHEQLPDDTFNVLVQGVCRARITDEQMPDADRLYRTAILDPVGSEVDEGMLASTRDRIERRLSEGPLTRMSAAEPVLEYFHRAEIPNSTVLELASFVFVTRDTARYHMLAEPDPAERAAMLDEELDDLERLLRLADLQQPGEWPKGMSWN